MIDHSLFPILSKFERLSWKSGDSNLGECRCPAHDDSTNSLHVTIKTGDDGQPKIMLKCHAGCSNAEILRAMGEGFSSLFPDRSRAPKPSPSSAGKGAKESKLVKVYDYHDADGKLLHQTLRYEPKSFAQRGKAEPNTVYKLGGRDHKSFKDPHGNWWINSLNHIEPVIYGLPEILKADPKKIIFQCEGEKDADNLRKAYGVYATTVPMGSGKWRSSYNSFYLGRRVFIIPDFDRPRKGQTDPAANAGFDGARKVAAELVKVAAEVRIVYLPDLGKLTPKWDLSDWIEAGGTKEQFLEACNAAPILHPDHPGLIPAGMTAADAGAASSSSAGSEAGSSSETKSIGNIIETAEGFEPLPMPAILAAWNNLLSGWPKRVGNSLFFVQHRDSLVPEIQTLRTTAAVFGWAGTQTGSVIAWARTAGCPSKEEFVSELQRTQEAFAAIERFPHEPPIESHYYAIPEQLPIGNGVRLNWLLDRFSPSTDVDRDLILSYLMTLFWGGPGGSRPAFVATSEDGGGQGVGKSTLFEAGSELVGGTIDVSSHEDISKIKERLLSPEGQRRRVVLLDNLKSLKFSWAELEALITARSVSGKELYVGEGQRPNVLTWAITMNGLELSRDMSQRSVIIKLRKPTHSANWKEETFSFLNEHRWEIISDIITKLREPRKPLAKYSRWGHWERDVLSRLPLPEDAQRLILERQESVDADGEEAIVLEDYFARCLKRLGYDPGKSNVFIPSRIACEWLSAAFRERLSINRATAILKMHTSTGASSRLTYQRLSAARGFVWAGAECLPYEALLHDIEERIREERNIREASGSGFDPYDVDVPSDRR
jgi:hypothetical protein